ncbi:MAG TPA: ATPase domain-containing protein [Polyangia bacterium]|nr:ATPase domain-containing protein [Polyangia bacterium]
MSDDVVKTGIAGLDQVLGGGFRPRQGVLITGEPGTGKTVLSSHIAFLHAGAGHPTVFATLTSETQDKLLGSLRSFGFFREDVVGNQLFLVNMYSWLKRGPDDLRRELTEVVRSRRARLLVIDGLRAVRDIWKDEALVREFIYEMCAGLAVSGCLVLMTTEYRMSRVIDYPEATAVDGIISLSVQEENDRAFRRVQVAKLRGQDHLTGRHVMRIAHGGVVIYPRLEAQVRSQPYQPSRPRRRAAFGIAKLDEMLHGGIPTPSTTVLAGTTGVGKTLLSLQFLAEGASKGERGVYLSFSEEPEPLIGRMERIGVRLRPLVEGGLVRIEYRAPLNLEADELLAYLLECVASTGATRCVLDAVDELERAVPEGGRLTSLLTALSVKLRAEGVSLLALKKIGELTSSGLDFADTAISTIVENLMVIRKVELRGHMRRVLAVMTMRDTSFETEVHEFEVSDTGIRVGRILDDAEGVLSRSDPRVVPRAHEGNGRGSR